MSGLNGKRSPAIVFRSVWVWLHYVRQGGGLVIFGGAKCKTKQKGMERAGAGLKPKWKEHSQMDFSFLCCLVGQQQSVMSRSQTWSSDQARCQNLHTAATAKCHFQVTSRLQQRKSCFTIKKGGGNNKLLHFDSKEKMEIRVENLSLSSQRDPRCCVAVCSRTLQPQITTNISFPHTPYWAVSMK